MAKLKLAHLTTPRIVDYRDELLKTSSRGRAQKALTTFKMIVREMQRRGLVAQNVAQPVRITAKARDRKLLAIGQDVPSKTEIRALLATVSLRWRPWLMTAVLTGMRVSELRGLSWESVDFERRVIEVRQRADRWRGLGAPKTAAGTRTIPIPEELWNCLRDWRLACPHVRKERRSRRAIALRLAPLVHRDFRAVWEMLRRCGDDEDLVKQRYRLLDAEGACGRTGITLSAKAAATLPAPRPAAQPLPGRLWLVFPNDRGKVIQHANLDQRIWRPLQVAAGVVNARGRAKYGLHKLRHYFASWMIEQGFEPKRLQEILGHGSITMTYDRYGHWFPKPLDDCERMDAGVQALLAGK